MLLMTKAKKPKRKRKIKKMPTSIKKYIEKRGLTKMVGLTGPFQDRSDVKCLGNACNLHTV